MSFLISVTRIACLALLVGLPLWGATTLSVGSYQIDSEGDGSVALVTVNVANTADLALLRVRVAFDPTVVEYVTASAQALVPRVLGTFDAFLTEVDGEDSVLTLNANNFGSTVMTAAPGGAATFTFELQAVSDGVSPLTFPRNADSALDQHADLSSSVVDTISVVSGQISVNALPGVISVDSDEASTPDGYYKEGDTITLLVQFDTTVDVTGTPALTLETGSNDGVAYYQTGSSTDTLEFAFTVAAGHNSNRLEYRDTGALTLNGGDIVAATNGGDVTRTLPQPGTDGSLSVNANIRVDTNVPTVTLSTDQSNPSKDVQFVVNITFSEGVGGLLSSEIDVVNGTVAGLVEDALLPGRKWTATIDPAADGDVTVSLDADVAQDSAGNNSTGSAPLTVAFDRQAPTVTLSSTEPNPTSSQIFALTVEFSEPVSGFALGDLDVVNGNAGNLQVVTTDEKWTVDITAAAEGVVTVDLAAGAAQDSATNPSDAAGQFTIEYALDGIVYPQASVGGPFGAAAEVPIRIDLDDGIEVTALTFSVAVAPAGGAPALVGLPSFVPAEGLPAMSLNNNAVVPGTVLLRWQASSGLALSGTGILLGTLTVPVPVTAAEGQTYIVAADVSAAVDNGTPVDVIGREGMVTVTPAWYLVGDVAPAGMGEAGGSFGDGFLDNADIRTASYWEFGFSPPGGASDPVPTGNTDRWDAGNAYGQDSPPTAGGDASMDQTDIELTFRRSLLSVSAFPRYERRRLLEGGRESRVASEAEAIVTSSQAMLSAGQVEEEAGTVVSIPLTLAAGSTTLTTFQFLASVIADGGASAIPTVTFVKNPGLAAAPDFNDNTTIPGAALVGWAFDIAGGVTGSLVIGSLAVTVPADGVYGDTWAVQVENVSGTNQGSIVPMDGTAGALAVKPPPLIVDSTTPDAAQSLSVYEGGDRQCSLVVSGGVLPYTYAWTLDSVPIEGADGSTYTYAAGYDVVAHPALTAGKTLSCMVTDSHGAPASVQAVWNVTVQDVDQDATAPVISVTPSTPRTGEDGSVTVTANAVDSDGDAVVEYAAKWTLRGSDPLVTVSGMTLGNADTRKGQTWDVSVAAVTDPYGVNGENVTSELAASASVTISNTPPVGVGVSQIGAHKNAPRTVELTAVDPDVDDSVDTLSFAIVTPPQHGTMIEADRGSGTFTFTPADDYTGVDGFSFQVSDGDATSAVVNVGIIVLDFVLRLDLTGASVGALELGTEQGATPAFDVGWGSILPPPPEGFGEALFLAPEGEEPALKRLQRDVRGGFAGQHWQIEASADASNGVLISWDPADLPAAVTLLVWRLTGRDGEIVPGSVSAMSATTSLTVPAGETHYYAIGAEIAFEIETDPVLVAEGSTGSAKVRLTGMPAGPLTAAVSWSSGDTDLSVVSGQGDTLSFDGGNWQDWQTVSVAAGEDNADTSSDSATFTVSATGGVDPVVDADVVATEQDDDVSVTFAVAGSGTTIPATETLVDTNDAPALDINATADAEWQFVEWTVAGSATFGAATISQTTVTPTGDVTVTAHFTAALAVTGQTPSSPASVAEGASRQFSVTAGDGVPGYTYVWTLDDTPISGAVSASYTYTPGADVVDHPDKSVLKTLLCTVTDSAGEPATAGAQWSIIVQDVDQDAGAPTISLSSDGPLTGDDVLLSVTQDAVDPDTDVIVDYVVTWTLRDSDPVVTVTGTTLGSGHTRKGETWDVSTAAVTDPYGVDGENVTSPTAATTSVSIGNTVPLVGDVPDLVGPAEVAIPIQLEGIDPDVDQGVDTLIYEIMAEPTSGQLGTIDHGTGVVTYQPNVGFDGMDMFSYQVSDGEDSSPAVATVSIFVYNGWLVEVSADGATPGSVTFGVSQRATSAFDGDFDIDADVGDSIAFVGDAGYLRRDIHGPQDASAWELRVTVGDTPVGLSWEAGALPTDGLILCELTGAGGECVPGSRLDMFETTELLIEPTRETSRYYAVLPRLRFDLSLETGWNLVSVPIDPLDSSVEAVFSVSDVHADAVYAWLPLSSTYGTVATVQAVTGYWVYSDAAVVVTVNGVPVVHRPVELEPGWNLVGVPGAAQIGENPDVFFPAWRWNAAVPVYGALHSGDTVSPGQAFWVYALQAAELELIR